MNNNAAIPVLQTLAHAGRLSVFRLLVRHAPHPLRPGEMVEALDLKPSTLSVHLAALARAGLISHRRVGTSLLYRLEMDQMSDLLAFLAAECCNGRADLCLPAARTGPLRTLFVCEGNSARSQMAEVVLRDRGAGRFRAASLGQTPRRQVADQALTVLERQGHEVSGLTPKGPDQMAELGPFDLVITLCDRAANQMDQAWPGLPLTTHWGLPAPKGQGVAGYDTLYHTLRQRIDRLIDLPLTGTRADQQAQIDSLAEGGMP